MLELGDGPRGHPGVNVQELVAQALNFVIDFVTILGQLMEDNLALESVKNIDYVA